MVLPNILTFIFIRAIKKKAKGALYACNIDHISVKRTEEVKGKNKQCDTIIPLSSRL
jgi:hypothetical protein